jgi:hypothetical protein
LHLYFTLPSSYVQGCSVAELIELRKLKKSREGIDAAKLGKGDGKRKKKRTQSESEKGGLRPGVKGDESEE